MEDSHSVENEVKILIFRVPPCVDKAGGVTIDFSWQRFQLKPHKNHK